MTTLLLAALMVGQAPAQSSADRDLSTDRPDKTESAHTVPVGRFQLEIDAVSYGRTAEAGVVAHSVESGVNAKFGVGRNSDVQFVFVPLNYQRAGRFSQTSTGEVGARFKHNLFGNDGGRAALALMPFVTFVPGAPDRVMEGGLIIPLGVDLGGSWGLGTMAEVDFVKLDRRAGRHPVLVYSITVGRDLGSKAGFYVELFNAYTPALAADRLESTFDAGVTYGVTPDFQLDVGMNVGLTSTAADLNPFIGLSVRF